MRRVRHFGLVCGLVLGLGLFLAACGSSSGGGGNNNSAPITATNGKVTVIAHDIYFNTKEIDASPGPLTVTYENQGSLLHTFVIGGQNFKLTAPPHSTKMGTVTLKAGTYSFYCDIPGHRAAGMNGKLVVK